MKIYNFMEVSANFSLAPEAAVEHFQAKGLALTFDWRDMLGEEHDAAVTVAKMIKVDSLVTKQLQKPAHRVASSSHDGGMQATCFAPEPTRVGRIFGVILPM